MLLVRLLQRLGGLLGMAFLLGLSLLPLAALLLALPAFAPNESVLADTTSRGKLRIGRRIFALLASLVVLLTLLAGAMEIVRMLPLRADSYFGDVLKGLLPERLANALPPTLIERWPYVMFVVYLSDVILLFAIGKVPLKYNLRNLIVRWPTTVLTAVAFTVVIGLLVVMLAFVNGVYSLTASSGTPGNILIMSDAATDEIFSNLGYGEIDNLQFERVRNDPNGVPLPKSLGIKVVSFDGKPTFLVSKETYSVVNMILPPKAGAPSRRFIQLRGIFDAKVAAAVRNLELLPGGRWFTSVGSKDGVIEAVVGEGLAETLGEDAGKPSLGVGDRFELALNTYEIVGVMKSAGTAVGSELWANWSTLKDRTGKGTFTTCIVRVEDDSTAGAEAFARHLSLTYKNPKVNARTEEQYFASISKTNKQFLYCILVIAAVMAIGGVFGVMNTMFASIAQRIKDIGVLRILGYKRWQVMTSFMLESLTIGLLGGALGCALGTLADGLSAKSILSGGQGPGGKSVVLQLTVSTEVILCGILFTFVMGRLGGMLPSLNAMRLSILDTLR